MLPRDVREPIDNPSNLMVTSIASGARAINALRAIVLLYEWKEFFIDGLEDVLAPGDKIAPNTDVVPKVRKPFSLSLQNNLKITRTLLEVHGCHGCQCIEYLSGLLKFDTLLEMLDEWDVHSGNNWRQGNRFSK